MLNGSGWTIARIAQGEPSRAAWLAALGDPAWAASAKTFKEEGGDGVLRARLRVAGQDREVVVKHRRLRGPLEAIKALLGSSRLVRQWRGGVWLARRGMATARPLALVRQIGPLGGQEVLVTEFVAGRSLLEHLADRSLDRPGAAVLAAEVGRFTARLAASGRYNRDHKPSNLIVAGSGGAPRIAIIDPVAIRPTIAAWRGLDRMLAALVLEPAGCGCSPTPWEMRCAVRAAAAELARGGPALRGRGESATSALAWALWSAAADIVESHGDPTPRTDPLARHPAAGGNPDPAGIG